MNSSPRSSSLLRPALLLLLAGLGAARLAAAPLTPTCTEPSSGRYALVMGNSAYVGDDKVSGALDASDMAKDLCQLHFTVFELEDGFVTDMRSALGQLQTQLAQAALVLIFYSGHGYQLNGITYLLPRGAVVNPAHPERSISLREVYFTLSFAPIEAQKLVFLDACRKNEDQPAEGPGGEATLGKLPGWQAGLGLPDAANPPPHTLTSYATIFGGLAESGPPEGHSFFSNALLLYIREPGLSIKDLIFRVHDDVAKHTLGQQTWSDHPEAIADPTYLQNPVVVTAVVDDVDDELFVLLGGKVVLTTDRATSAQLPLLAGSNSLSLMIYNQKSYRNNQGWERTEGWRYKMRLLLPDGTQLSCTQAGQQVPCFAGLEDVPFKDGPHHGKLFQVASAVLNVNQANPVVTLDKWDGRVWETGDPLRAKDQVALYEKSLLDLLPLRGFRGLGGVLHPDKICVVVRGNASEKGQVRACMEEASGQRRLDFLSSGLAALNGSPTPFDAFTNGLATCVGAPVWVDVEDRSHDQPPGTCGAGG